MGHVAVWGFVLTLFFFAPTSPEERLEVFSFENQSSFNVFAALGDVDEQLDELGAPPDPEGPPLLDEPVIIVTNEDGGCQGFFDCLGDFLDDIGDAISGLFGGGGDTGGGGDEGRGFGEGGGTGAAPTSPQGVAWNAPQVGRGTDGCPLEDCHLVSRSFVTETGDRAVVYSGYNTKGDLVYITPVEPPEAGEAPGGDEPSCIFFGLICPDTGTETTTTTTTTTDDDDDDTNTTTNGNGTNNTVDTDGDGINDAIDTDDDGDGINDTVDTDDDGDGIDDAVDTNGRATSGTPGGGTSGSSGGCNPLTQDCDGGNTTNVSGCDPATADCDGGIAGGTSCVSNYNGNCTGTPNACGMSYSGRITCTGSCNAPMRPNTDCPRPTISLSASPDFVERGNACTLTWSAQNATECVITGFGVNHTGGPSGSTLTPGLDRQETYTARCFNGPDVSGTAQTTCRLNPEFEEI
ncbi:MAG: hypothetical protein HY455_00790 [Parcubacteria group bacterium]|nr:hypothetical protein [Parcubacteria group bacterium]